MMAESDQTLAGCDRAAVLLLSLEEQDAAAVLRLMSPQEVERLSMAMANLRGVGQEMAASVLDAFIARMEAEAPVVQDPREQVRRILSHALGEPRAQVMADRLFGAPAPGKGLETVKWCDTRTIAETIAAEHPQVIAIVLSHLEAGQAAQVIDLLPEALRGEVILRIANLDGVPQDALEALDELLQDQLAGTRLGKRYGLGGVKVAADIINALKTAADGHLLEQLAEQAPDLAEQIRERMFVFEHLLSADDRGIQALLREVSPDLLVLALKGADDRILDKIFRNMSQRAAEMLRDDLAAKGPVRLSDVEAAQKEILNQARRLAEQGRLILAGSGGEAYV
ncbi:MAG TPA: flagellar motor switch protein FliG [Candidatus Acidoferrales bacterium]|nr:flagellar motor switch protein FliG [Candidatus Acidoferrales bacterium]